MEDLNGVWKAFDVLEGEVDTSTQKKIVTSTMMVKFLEGDDRFKVPKLTKWSNIIFSNQELKDKLVKYIRY